MGVEGAYLNLIKAKYEKRTANIILNGQKLKALPLRSGTRHGTTVTTSIQDSTGSLVTVIRQEKEIKGIQIGK